jgi:uncharacterized protein
MTALKIPYNQLSDKALQGLIENFVTRDSTDYGEIEIPLETKINQVLKQLQSGKAAIVFDRKSQTCNILRSNDPAVKVLDDD